MKNWQIVAIVIAAIAIGIGAGYYFTHDGMDQQKSTCGPNQCIQPCAQEGLQDAENMKIDRISRLYAKGETKLPFMETVTFTHNVSWLKGRSALVQDYARHYHTSLHFISRSLSEGKEESLHPKLSQGDSFNVIRQDKKIEFYLVVDLSRRFMHMYAYDVNTGERYLLKIYKVGVGSLDPTSASGCETPTGLYALDRKVGVYTPGVVADMNGRLVELCQHYGTRYLPFGGKDSHLGIQGNPWVVDSETGELTEVRTFIGQYATEGNIRMHTEDVEQLFSIVTSRPTKIEIVKDFSDAHLPGREVDY